MSWSAALFWTSLITGALAIWYGTRPKKRMSDRHWVRKFQERE